MTKSLPSKLTINLSLPVIVSREGKYFIAYTPSLELSSYGKSLSLAKKRFEELVGIFLEDNIKQGSLEDTLLSLGWEIDTRDNTINPPVVIEHTITTLKVPKFAYA